MGADRGDVVLITTGKRGKSKGGYKRKFKKKRKRVPLPYGLPNTYTCRLKYREELSLNPLAAAIDQYVYSCTGMYDPNATGAGHQPLYFDNLMTLYDHYQVIGAKITVSYRPSIATGAVVPGTFGILLSDTGTRVAGATSITHLLEMPLQAKPRVVGNQVDSTPKVVSTFAPKRFFGKGYTLSNDKYQGGASTNPSDNAFFEVWLASNGANNPDGMNFDVLIEYIAHFSERKPPAQS